MLKNGAGEPKARVRRLVGGTNDLETEMKPLAPFNPSFFNPRSMAAAFVAALVFALSPAKAVASEARAHPVAVEVARMTAEATAVVGALQADINAGTAGGKASPAQLFTSFQERYLKAAGKAFDEQGTGLEAEARKTFAASLRDTNTRLSPVMIKGGTDAVVPAYYRAELLKRFNGQMRGKVQVYATTRKADLINADWAVEKVMKGSPFAAEVAKLMEAGGLTPVTVETGDRQMVYIPMRLAAGCVACHARNGINQKEGDFGGALVTEVWLRR
ncbi:MAG: hypothetical protein ING40_16220 [Burkholderiales bacterium]|nr:hypothetical protein [Burkholderiales bacterium]